MIYAFKDHLYLKHFRNTFKVCFTFANLLEHALRARQHLVAFMQQACFAFETDLNNGRECPLVVPPLDAFKSFLSSVEKLSQHAARTLGQPLCCLS